MNSIKKNKRVRAYLLKNLQAPDDEEDMDGINAGCSSLEETDEFVLELCNEKANVLDENNSEEPSGEGLQYRASSVFSAELFDFSVLHVMTKSNEPTITRRCNKGQFYGIAIDTCFSYRSTGGNEQYLAYCAFVGIEPNLSESSRKGVRFGIGSTLSLGMAKV